MGPLVETLQSFQNAVRIIGKRLMKLALPLQIVGAQRDRHDFPIRTTTFVKCVNTIDDLDHTFMPSAWSRMMSERLLWALSSAT